MRVNVADFDFPDNSLLFPVHGEFLIKQGSLSETDLGNVNSTHNFLHSPG